LPFNELSASAFGQLSTHKLKIGTQDLLIASVTLAHHGVLLTRNLRHYRQITGLQIEDWAV
jgi:tRNA(fMet)-specific endonuclease VapC